MTLKGHCLCRAVAFEMTGKHNWVGHCHCDSCRRNAGAALVTFVARPNGQWRWTGTEPAQYASSPGQTRYFCAICGSSVAYASERYADEIHFHAVLLEDPAAVTPRHVFHSHERLPSMPQDMPGCKHR
ncbi:GFA family protein [Roseovarius aestuariivivens]|uniref:GFA family protein n=1 Tax=Roseovarius aestuariivivens TaxID=1888910 RepID=UPI001081F85F|nr:GFA family protein [Roseovarius aestuariivivens]